MAYRMRDGSEVTDVRLGRLPEFDERSRDFPVAKRLLRVTPAIPKRGRSWWTPHPRMHQNGYPRCVSYAGGNRLRGTPVMNKSVDHDYCDFLYARAQFHDEWPDTSPYDGTSGLGLAKALLEEGLIDGYYWCFSVEEILTALAYAGPVLVGWPWYRSMMDPPHSQLGKIKVDPNSGLEGYHEVLLRGFSVTNRTCRLTNQWGEAWGHRGETHVRWDDMRDHLLPNQGDALVLNEVRP
jgi:hypothetical protein